MTNNPKILVELSPAEAAYLMDLMHDDWNRQVVGYAISSGGVQHDEHVRQFKKNRPSRLMRYIDDKSESQGFGFL